MRIGVDRDTFMEDLYRFLILIHLVVCVCHWVVEHIDLFLQALYLFLRFLVALQGEVSSVDLIVGFTQIEEEIVSKDALVTAQLVFNLLIAPF